jgi:hypothetical protein
MNAVMNRWRPIVIALSSAVTVVVLGCAGDESGLDRRYKVTGHVTYNSQPVAKGTIAFEPSNPPVPIGRHASGFIENGYYTLTTAIEGDGALPGEYKVVISSSSVDFGSSIKSQPGLAHQGGEEFKKAVKAGKSLVPVKYANSTTSGLTAKVETRAMTFDFDLTDK